MKIKKRNRQHRGGNSKQDNSDLAWNTDYHLDLHPPLEGQIHAKKRRSTDEQRGFWPRLAIYESFALFLHVTAGHMTRKWKPADQFILFSVAQTFIYVQKVRKTPSSDWETDNKPNQKNREEFKSTYLPLHRPLHAASVQSKSRTEIISNRAEQPALVLSMMHSLRSTFTCLGCSSWGPLHESHVMACIHPAWTLQAHSVLLY